MTFYSLRHYKFYIIKMFLYVSLYIDTILEILLSRNSGEVFKCKRIQVVSLHKYSDRIKALNLQAAAGNVTYFAEPDCEYLRTCQKWMTPRFLPYYTFCNINSEKILYRANTFTRSGFFLQSTGTEREKFSSSTHTSTWKYSEVWFNWEEGKTVPSSTSSFPVS
jgi:hypothetical protein